MLKQVIQSDYIQVIQSDQNTVSNIDLKIVIWRSDRTLVFSYSDLELRNSSGQGMTLKKGLWVCEVRNIIIMV